MGYLVTALVVFFVGWKLGRKYQDLQDIMLARRVTKIIEQGNSLALEKEQYKKWQAQDERVRKVIEKEVEEA